MIRRRCRCGHLRAAHSHYRTGADCALCPCIVYQPRRWWHPKHS